MTSVPQLLTSNRFSVLPIDKIEDITPTAEPELEATPENSSFRCYPKWECRIPSKPVIASLDAHGTSLYLQIELKTTDTAVRTFVRALVDCGATGSFIDCDFIWEHKLNTCPLSQLVAVFNVDGSPNEAGYISK